MTASRTKFPHLYGCMERLAAVSEGKGLCFHRSAALVLDLHGSEVVMGTFRAATPEERKSVPNASTVPFIHCWVEYEGSVYAPSLIERMNMTLHAINPDDYYRANEARDTYRLTRDALLRATAGMGLSSFFRHGTPLKSEVEVSTVMLHAAGVPYELTPERTVIPAQQKDVAL